ncbi:DUF3570 domain-containing protein [Saccharospirillum impatiens]|uniref:DUF3570 domain-containing protein n=1 Tax=Saccharospirillum impatiens TaxID=169438 RepID=UPI000403725B|nr:DUF3570 domain-containing protein [Saccharospirillum impatiens]
MTHDKNRLTHGAALGSTLAAIGCSVLQGLPNQAMAGELEKWDADAAVLQYAESDNRVQATEAVVGLTRNVDSETQLNLKLTVDTLSGASPNGAMPDDQPQTFTRPSGNGRYTVDANALPLDDTFRDTRTTGAVQWSAPLGRDWTYSGGISYSSEHDYESRGVNASLSRFFNQKNTTLTLASSLSTDTVSPEGGLPVGLSAAPEWNSGSFEADFDASRNGSEADKQVIDVVLGLTQIIDRRTLMQFNYSLSLSDGYMNDPYKLISVYDEPGGTVQEYRYEARPDTRQKHALFWQTKHQFESSNIIDGSYRFLFDDWGMTSHTLDLKYRWGFGNQYLEPQVRWYRQSAIDAYQPYMTSAQLAENPDALTADYRLGDFDAWTLGMRYGYRFNADTEVYTRFAAYQQNPRDFESASTPANSGDLPGMTAYMLTLGVKF